MQCLGSIAICMGHMFGGGGGGGGVGDFRVTKNFYHLT